jgi:creatinine amidohydrolase
MKQWQDRDWRDFAGAARDIAVLPVAAVEQHGPHLPLGVDALIGQAYLDRVAAVIGADLPVVLLPMQQVGCSEEHQGFPGTLSLSAETTIGAWTEIGESVRRAGLRKLVIVTSHGGNWPVMEIVARRLRARHGMLVVTISWHRFGYPPGLFAEDEIRHGIHGGDIETSIMLAARPDLVRREHIADFVPASRAMERNFKWLRAHKPAGFGWMTQDLNPSGAVGDARGASAEKGKGALDHGARAFVELLHDVERFDLATLAPGPG